jgi:hypothetical protein
MDALIIMYLFVVAAFLFTGAYTPRPPKGGVTAGALRGGSPFWELEGSAAYANSPHLFVHSWQLYFFLKGLYPPAP